MGMRSFQIYLLHSETEVPITSTNIPSAISKKVHKLSVLGHAAETQITVHLCLGHHLKIN